MPAGVGGLHTFLVRASRVLSDRACSRLFTAVLRALRVSAGSGGWLRRAERKLERTGGRFRWDLPARLCAKSLRRSAHDLASVVFIVPATQQGIALA